MELLIIINFDFVYGYFHEMKQKVAVADFTISQHAHEANV
jgi:hypothetical protein